MNITFKTMMKIFELMKDESEESICESAKLLGIDDLNFNDQIVVLDEVTKYVFDVNERHSTNEKTFDLNLDYKYYFTDFLRLGINLNFDEISWWEFDAILEGLFLDENSILSKMLNFRLYEKPPKNAKAQEDKEHKFRMKMKQKYSLPSQENPDFGLQKLWNYVEKKAGDNKEC